MNVDARAMPRQNGQDFDAASAPADADTRTF